MDTKEFAKKINALGCDYLDAPVSGGEVGARSASLAVMVGGPETAFVLIKPLFELMGNNISLVGGNGDRQTCNIANQIIVALNDARSLGVAFPQTVSAAQLIQACAANGMQVVDHSALVCTLKIMGNHEIAWGASRKPQYAIRNSQFASGGYCICR